MKALFLMGVLVANPGWWVCRTTADGTVIEMRASSTPDPAKVSIPWVDLAGNPTVTLPEALETQAADLMVQRFRVVAGSLVLRPETDIKRDVAAARRRRLTVDIVALTQRATAVKELLALDPVDEDLKAERDNLSSTIAAKRAERAAVTP